MRRLDRIALTVIGLTVLLIASVVLLGNQASSITVACPLASHDAQFGPFGSVALEFSRPVQANLVQRLWQTTPPLEGRWEWPDTRHALWRSVTPLPANRTIILQLRAGEVGQQGEPLNRTYRWEGMVRAPRILAIGGRELFVFNLEGGAGGAQITHTDSHVYDAVVSPDGDSVVFSAVNSLNGIDLWLVQRDGTDQHLLLNCEADQCSTPAWSPVSPELAYTRRSSGLDPHGPKGAPRVWILDLPSGQTAPLFSDNQEIGFGPRWSPDGQWLSMWDGAQGVIKVFNRKAHVTWLFETPTGDVGCWTPDSHFLYYSGEVGSRDVILQANASTGVTSTVFAGDDVRAGARLQLDYPACNPRDPSAAVVAQTETGTPSAGLFLLEPGPKGSQLILDDPSLTPGFSAWAPTGDRLVFQTDRVGGQEQAVEIWVWDRANGAATKVIDGYRFPQWLP